MMMDQTVRNYVDGLSVMMYFLMGLLGYWWFAVLAALMELVGIYDTLEDERIAHNAPKVLLYWHLIRRFIAAWLQFELGWLLSIVARALLIATDVCCPPFSFWDFQCHPCVQQCTPVLYSRPSAFGHGCDSTVASEPHVSVSQPSP